MCTLYVYPHIAVEFQERSEKPDSEFMSNGDRLSGRFLLVEVRTKSYSRSIAADLNPA